MRLPFLAVTLGGCSVVYYAGPPPQQAEAPKVISPACIVSCVTSTTTTSQQGAHIDGAAGAVSIQKPVTETTTQTLDVKKAPTEVGAKPAT